MGSGRYRLRDEVQTSGRLVTCRRPLVATRLNDAGRDLVDALSSSSFRSVADVADETDVPPDQVASLFESLRQRGLLEWAPERAPSYRPPVSVVLTVRNEGDTIAACLDALADLSYPEYEVVIVDDGSTDGTRAAIRAHPLWNAGGVTLVTADESDGPLGIGAARNRGVDEAAHDVIAFTDADCRPRPDWLADLVPCLGGHDVVGGRIRPHGEGGLSAFEGDHSSLDMGPRASPVDRASGTPYLATANLVGHRAVFERVRFPDRNVAEDVDVCWRALDAGYDVVYAADGVVEHAYGGLGDFVSRRLSYGRSEGLLAGEYGHPGAVSVPVAMAVGTVALTLGLGLGPAVGLTDVGTLLAALAGTGLVLAFSTARRTAAPVFGSDTPLGSRDALVGLVRGGSSRLYAVGTELARYYSLPMGLVAAGLLLAGFETGAAGLLAMVAVSLVGPPTLDYAVHRPATTIFEYVGWNALDALAYQVGAYLGALRHRTWTHLDLRHRFELVV